MKNVHAFTSHQDGAKRYFFRLKNADDRLRDRLEVQLEIVFNKRVAPGFKIHFGDRGSETPFDAHISLYWIAIFFGASTPNMGEFFQKFCGGHKRNISLKFHNGSMWWELWYDDDLGYDSYHRCDSWRRPKLPPWSWGRKKHRSWMCLRRGNIYLNPLDAFFGTPSYHYEPLASINAMVSIGQFEGDDYDVKLTLQKQTRSRKHGPEWVRGFKNLGYSVHWECTDGIPFRNDAWKGNNVYSSGIRMGVTVDHWITKAITALVADIQADRQKYNYRPELSK